MTRPLEIFYLENVARPDTWANVLAETDRPLWKYGRVTDPEADPASQNVFWQQELARSHWVAEVLWYEIMVKLYETAPQTENYNFKIMKNVVCGGKTFGQDGSIHTDAEQGFNELGDGYMTVCFFPNAEWNPEWGGEFQFFNDKGEVIQTYYPNPNSCLIFDATIPHRGLGPTRNCNKLRKCITFNTFVHKQWYLENNKDVQQIENGNKVAGMITVKDFVDAGAPANITPVLASAPSDIPPLV
jgi:2OG-Fe(II) oxygenase superfamily